MKFSAFLISLFFLSNTILAQFGEKIATARPGVANGSGVVGKGILQFQAGVQYNQTDFETIELSTETSNISENLVVRFGLSERWEVSTVLSYSSAETRLGSTGEIKQRTGFSNSLLRARFILAKNLAIQAAVSMPLYQNDYKTDYAASQFRIMYTTRFTDYFSLVTNLGFRWDGFERSPDGFYALKLITNLSKNFILITESFGSFDRSAFRDTYNAGIGYFLNNDLLIDVSGGFNKYAAQQGYFFTAGASYRMITPFRKEK